MVSIGLPSVGTTIHWRDPSWWFDPPVKDIKLSMVFSSDAKCEALGHNMQDPTIKGVSS